MLTLAYAGGMSETKLLELVASSGIVHPHLDDTSTRVDGDGQYCQILCNPLDTAYRTTPGKDRRTIIDVLRGGRPAAYRYDRDAERHLAFPGLSAAAQTRLRASIPREQELD